MPAEPFNGDDNDNAHDAAEQETDVVTSETAAIESTETPEPDAGAPQQQDGSSEEAQTPGGDDEGAT